MMLDVNEIMRLLPHRYPFLLVDRVTELVIDDSIKAYKNVTANEEFFVGHFPGNPIMPGVLIIEALAQACGVLGFKTLGKLPQDGWLYMIVGVNKARFRRPVVPGDRLDLSAQKRSKKRGIWVFECTAKVGDEIAAQVELLVAEKQVDSSSTAYAQGESR